jgi:hypothetical protein
LGDLVDRERVLLQLRLVQVILDDARRRGVPSAELAQRSSDIVEAAVAGVDLSTEPTVSDLLTSLRSQLAELGARAR